MGPVGAPRWARDPRPVRGPFGRLWPVLAPFFWPFVAVLGSLEAVRGRFLRALGSTD